jgi:hypothetical protein
MPDQRPTVTPKASTSAQRSGYQPVIALVVVIALAYAFSAGLLLVGAL